MKLKNANSMLRFTLLLVLSISILFGCQPNQQQGAMENEVHEETGIFAQGETEQLGYEAEHSFSISSANTALSSENFPHTKAIPIQHARFVYIIDQQGVHKWRDQFGLPDIVTPQQPEQGQPAPAPTQPERQPQAPADQPQGPGTPTEQPQQPAPRVEEPRTPTVEQPQPAEPPQQAGDMSDFERQVAELTNAERRRNGLSDLQLDASLSHVAREKSNDMQVNNYFSHTSPTYGSPFDMMRDFGVSYNAAAENIAYGQRTPEQVLQAWMGSEGHRQNILNGNFTHIGVGYNPNGHYWTQMFISK